MKRPCKLIKLIAPPKIKKQKIGQQITALFFHTHYFVYSEITKKKKKDMSAINWAIQEFEDIGSSL